MPIPPRLQGQLRTRRQCQRGNQDVLRGQGKSGEVQRGYREPARERERCNKPNRLMSAKNYMLNPLGLETLHEVAKVEESHLVVGFPTMMMQQTLITSQSLTWFQSLVGVGWIFGSIPPPLLSHRKLELSGVGESPDSSKTRRDIEKVWPRYSLYHGIKKPPMNSYSRNWSIWDTNAIT